MRKKIITKILIWLICILVCGCTRREQLILEDVSAQQEMFAGLQTELRQDESGQQVLQEEAAGQLTMADKQSVPEESGEPQTIFVHVCGAVKNPDVYELPAGSRVYEAVQKAGGFAEDADSSYVNQAQVLSDGVKLVIPTLEQTDHIASEGEDKDLIGIVGMQTDSSGWGITEAAQNGQAEQGTASDGKININTASEAELCNIPGIGATRAAAIVAYRQEKGGFSSIEDIMNVSGIKEGTYEKIKDCIKID